MKQLSSEQVQFIKDNLRLMLKAKSVDEVVGMAAVLLNYVEHLIPEDIELWLLTYDPVRSKLPIIKEIRGHLNIGLAEAKDLVEQTNAPIYKGNDIQLALRLYNSLRKYAQIEIKGANPAMKILFGEEK